MDLSEISHPPLAVVADPTTAPTAPMPAIGSQPATYHQCDECAAAVDIDQRYCVSCGAHRRNVNDPAARYLSHATARSPTSRAVAGQKPTRHSGSGVRGLGVALLLALIPAVAAVGVLAGRSSNNQDAKLIQALAHNQAARAASTIAAPPTDTSTGGSSSATTQTRAHPAKSRKHSSGKVASAKSHKAASSTTQFGSVSQIAGAKPTKAQQQQGAQDAQKVQKSTGKTYVNGQSGLPSTVVVP